MDTKIKPPIEYPEYKKFSFRYFEQHSQELILNEFRVDIKCSHCETYPRFSYSQLSSGMYVTITCLNCSIKNIDHDGSYFSDYRNRVVHWIPNPYLYKEQLVAGLELLYNKWKFQQWMILAKPFDKQKNIIIVPESFKPKTLFTIEHLNEF